MPPAVMCATATLTEIALVLGFFFFPFQTCFPRARFALCSVEDWPQATAAGKGRGGNRETGVSLLWQRWGTGEERGPAQHRGEVWGMHLEQ